MSKSKTTAKDILDEAFSFTTPRTATSWETNMIRWPVGATTNSGASERNFLNQAKDHEERSKAPPIKPYPLDFINDSIVDIYTDLQKLKRTLKSAIKYPDLTSAEKQLIKKEIKNVSSMVEKLKEMYYNIDKITL